MNNILSPNHPSLKYAQDIDNIVTPIKKFGITHYTYLCQYPDGEQIYLSNHARWVQDYFDLKLYNKTLFKTGTDLTKNHYIIWSPYDENEVMAHGRYNHNSANGITLARHQADFCEFHFFSTTPQNFSIVNFYINNLDILENFIVHFKEKSKKILNTAKNNKIILPVNNANIEIIDKSILEKKNKQNNTSFNLSKRQSECLKFLLDGKSAKQTAAILNLSTRTVEFYIHNLKEKMQCRTKTELLGKIIREYDFLI